MNNKIKKKKPSHTFIKGPKCNNFLGPRSCVKELKFNGSVSSSVRT